MDSDLAATLDALAGGTSAVAFGEMIGGAWARGRACAAAAAAPPLDMSAVTASGGSAPGEREAAAERARARPLKPPPPRVDGGVAKSHTRRCREKVTLQFAKLLEELPPPPQGVEVKHKAQVLEYAIGVFRDMLRRRRWLRTEIALSSRTALADWISGVVETGAGGKAALCPVAGLLEPFVDLYCVKKGWKYGEVWIVRESPAGREVKLEASVFNADDDDVLAELHAFSDASQKEYARLRPLRSGLVSRAVASARPEWLPGLVADPCAFARAPLAATHGLDVAVAVPVFLGPRSVAAVLVFADIDPHTYATAELSLVSEYAGMVGAAYANHAAAFASMPPPSTSSAISASTARASRPQSTSSTRRVSTPQMPPPPALAPQALLPQALLPQALEQQALEQQALEQQSLGTQELVQQELVQQELVQQELVQQELVQQELVQQELVPQALVSPELESLSPQSQTPELGSLAGSAFSLPALADQYFIGSDFPDIMLSL